MNTNIPNNIIMGGLLGRKNQIIRFLGCILMISIAFVLTTNKIGAQTAMVITGDPLPPGYNFASIGQSNGPTRFNYDETTGTYTITHLGGGDTGWGVQDVCAMVYFETPEDKELVAKVQSFTATGWNSKTFCMIRSSLLGEASMAYMELRNADYGVINVARETDWQNINSNRGYSNFTPPLSGTWMKFVRQGKALTSYWGKDGKTWVRSGAPNNIVFRGNAIMGIGAAGCSGAVTTSFSDFVVRDILNPYVVNADTMQAFKNVTLNVGQTVDFDVTKVFGHYIGDIFSIDVLSTDPSVATVSSYQTPNTSTETGVDATLQMLRISGVKDGIITVKMSTNIAGFKMVFNFVVVVNGTQEPVVITPKDPNPWILKDFGLTSGLNPSHITFGTSVTDNLSVYGSMNGGLGSNGVTTSDTITTLYQLFNRSDNLRLVARIDSVKNTGIGSFAGLMLRDTLSAGSALVSLTVGAWEGIKFSYRWANNVSTTDVADNSILLPCWIMLDYSKDSMNRTVFQPYYSNDGVYWKSFIRYPFPMEFSNDKIMAGLVVQGGSNTTNLRQSLAVVNNLAVNVNTSEPIHLIDALNKQKETMTLFPNPLSVDPATITYKVIQPGNVYLAVYDAYGILVDLVYNGYQDIGKYTIQYNHNALRKSGIYLIKLISKGDYQTLKFIYQ